MTSPNKNEVVIVVKGDDRTGPVVEKAREEVKGVGVEAEKASQGLRHFGDETARAAGRSRDLKSEAAKVAEEIRKIKEELSGLEAKFIATGDSNLFGGAGGIDSRRGELARWQRLARNIAGELEEQAKEAGRRAGPQFLREVGGGLEIGSVGFRGPLIGVLVAAVAAAAPAIGVLVAGAVVGAVGAGGIVGGVLAAVTDSRVKAAGHTLGESLMGDFRELGGPFVQPVLDAIDRIQYGVKGLLGNDKLGAALKGLSSEVEPLADGLVGMGENAVPGLVDALEAARPVLRATSDGLKDLGSDISEMLSSMAEDPDAAILGMHLLFDAVGEVLKAFGKLVNFLGRVYESSLKIGLALTEAALAALKFAGVFNPVAAAAADAAFGVSDLNERIKEQFGALQKAKTGAGDYTGSLNSVTSAAQDAQAAVQGLADAVDDVFHKQMNMDEATVKWQKGLGELAKELRDGQRTISLYSEEGQKNREALLGQIDAANQLRDATFKQTGDVDAANAAYQRNIQSLYDMALKAGFAKTELDALFGPYFSGNALATLRFEFPGLFEGLTAAQAMARLTDAGRQAASWSSLRASERGHASGGPWGSGWGPINEAGGEMVRLPSGSMVIPAGASQAMLSGASGGESRGPIVVQLVLGGNVVREVMIDDALTRGVSQDTIAAAYP